MPWRKTAGLLTYIWKSHSLISLKKCLGSQIHSTFSHQPSISQSSDICFAMAGVCCLHHPSQATAKHWSVMLPVLNPAPITSSFRMTVPINTTKTEIVSVGSLPYGGWQLLNQIKTNTHRRRESKKKGRDQQSLWRKTLIWLLVFFSGLLGTVC